MALGTERKEALSERRQMKTNEVLAHQSAEGVRQRARQLKLGFQAWAVGENGTLLRKNKIFWEDNIFVFRHLF